MFHPEGLPPPEPAGPEEIWALAACGIAAAKASKPMTASKLESATVASRQKRMERGDIGPFSLLTRPDGRNSHPGGDQLWK